MVEECLPTEIWHRIIESLDAWDALKLRATSRNLYRVVTKFDSYWYRHFTWYLVRQDKKAAIFKTGCERRHKRNIRPSANCLSLAQEEVLARQLNITTDRLPQAINNNPELLDEFECTNVNHYVYDIPQKREQMPLSREDFNPEEQVYLYRFLIHNYRLQRQLAKNYTTKKVGDQLELVREELVKKRQTLSRLIARCKREIQQTKRRDAFLQDMNRRCRMLDENRVFYGRRSRQYKGLSHLLDS